MFDFLLLFLGKSLFTSGIDLLLQSILLFSIYQFRTVLWGKVCQRLSLFLFLKTLCQFIYAINESTLGYHVHMSVYIGMVILCSIPLFNLWIKIPTLLIDHKNEIELLKYKDRRETDINSRPYFSIHSEVTTRLMESLSRINKIQMLSS